jgi:hypothetical protein
VTPYNGVYKIRVEADVFGPHASESATAARERESLNVDNPPPTLAAPRILTKTTKSITVGWDATTVPDFRTYTLYRGTGAKTPTEGQMQPIATPTKTSYQDVKVQAGTFWYAVRVTRRSVLTPQEGISSAMSPISNSVTIVKPQPLRISNNANVAPSVRRYIPLRRLTVPQVDSGKLPPVPDAPYSAYLPYDKSQDSAELGTDSSEAGPTDPRGFVLPVAVGAFLVSSALALGRMPY